MSVVMEVVVVAEVVVPSAAHLPPASRLVAPEHEVHAQELRRVRDGGVGVRHDQQRLPSCERGGGGGR